MCQQGTGVAPSLVDAHLWLSLAADGFPDASEDLRDLAQVRLAGVAAQMTPAELAQAQQRARDWRAR